MLLPSGELAGWRTAAVAAATEFSLDDADPQQSDVVDNSGPEGSSFLGKGN